MLIRFALTAVLGAALASTALAQTPRPAPNIRWANGKNATLRAFRGQPVILLIAPSPRYGKVRSQMDRIWDYFRQITARQAVVLAAFTEEPGNVASNVPVAVVPDGADVAAAFGADPKRFTIAIISKDGNIDLISDEVQAGQRIIDVMINSAPVQEKHRRD